MRSQWRVLAVLVVAALAAVGVALAAVSWASVTPDERVAARVRKVLPARWELVSARTGPVGDVTCVVGLASPGRTPAEVIRTSVTALPVDGKRNRFLVRVESSTLVDEDANRHVSYSMFRAAPDDAEVTVLDIGDMPELLTPAWRELALTRANEAVRVVRAAGVD